MILTVTQEDLQFCICRNCLKGFISPEIGYRNAFCTTDCENQYHKYPWEYDENVRRIVWLKEVPKTHAWLDWENKRNEQKH